MTMHLKDFLKAVRKFGLAFNTSCCGITGQELADMAEYIEMGIKPDSMWLVEVEQRYNVVRVCCSGKGFYIPGQEPCWHLGHVDKWIKEIIPPTDETDE